MDTQHSSDQSQKPRPWPRPVKIAIALLSAWTALILAITVGLWSLIEAPKVVAQNIHDGLKALAEDVDGLLDVRPRITVGETVVIGERIPILELATVSEVREIRQQWNHEWLGSSKAIELQGRFRLKAGFDLKRVPFRMEVHGSQMTVYLPEPRLLSCELISHQMSVDNGWWNQISEDDRRLAMAGLLTAARHSEHAMTLIEVARQNAETAIRGAAERHQKDLRLSFHYGE